jgi:hypothetical protein
MPSFDYTKIFRAPLHKVGHYAAPHKKNADKQVEPVYPHIQRLYTLPLLCFISVVGTSTFLAMISLIRLL